MSPADVASRRELIELLARSGPTEALLAELLALQRHPLDPALRGASRSCI